MLKKRIQSTWETANILVHVKGRGIVVQEPSIVAVSVNDNKIVAVGEEARNMLGRCLKPSRSSTPLREGVIADYVVTEALLRYFIDMIAGRFRSVRPIVMVSVPVGVTSVEERAVRDVPARPAAGKHMWCRSHWLLPLALVCRLIRLPET